MPTPAASSPDAAAAGADLRAVTVRAWSVGLSTSTYGVSFGALAVAAGLSVPQTVVLSALLFSGGSQFAFVGLVGGGAAGAAIASSTLLGLRNGFYAIAVRRMVAMPGLRRVVGAQLTIDESTAVALAGTDDRARARGFWLTGGVVYLGWNTATLVGALLGDRLGDPARFGLDAVGPAAFLALLWPRLADRTSRMVAVGAVLVALGLAPLVPAGVPVVATTLVAVVAGVLGSRRPA